MTWAPDYATTAQLKGWVRIPTTDTDDDTELVTVITAASRAIDGACGRQFGQVASAEARTYEARYNRHYPGGAWVIEMDDVQDITGFTVSLTHASTAVTTYTLEPRNALLKGMPYTRLVLGYGAQGLPTAAYPEVTITAKWGWTTVPVTVLQAVKVQAHRLHVRRDSPYGVAGSPDMGTELRLLAKVDPDVELMLTPYVRKWYAL